MMGMKTSQIRCVGSQKRAGKKKKGGQGGTKIIDRTVKQPITGGEDGCHYLGWNTQAKGVRKVSKKTQEDQLTRGCLTLWVIETPNKRGGGKPISHQRKGEEKVELLWAYLWGGEAKFC